MTQLAYFWSFLFQTLPPWPPFSCLVTRPATNKSFQTLSKKVGWINSCFMFLWRFIYNSFQAFLKKSVWTNFCHMFLRRFIYIYTSFIHTHSLFLIILIIHTQPQKSALLCPAWLEEIGRLVCGGGSWMGKPDRDPERPRLAPLAEPPLPLLLPLHPE